MRLSIGTAQFGMKYGVTNAGGRVPEEEVARVLELAHRSDVADLDTAFGYGDAEEVLGRVLERTGLALGFRVVTKIPKIGDMGVDVPREAFTMSRERLRLQNVYALLLHDAEDLLGPRARENFDFLSAMKRQGLARKIGVSVYDGEQIERILDRFDAIDLVQVPINVFDQRLLAGGQLARLKSQGVEIHARSIFLQGALIGDPESLPARFEPFRGRIRAFQAAARAVGLTPQAVCLGFVRECTPVDVAVVGVESLAQFEEILRAASAEFGSFDFSRFATGDANLIDPRRWNA